MQLVGSGGQHTRLHLYDLSGTIASATLPQLVCANAQMRTSFVFQNISSANMFIEFGGARATATVTTGAVTSLTITNAGFGYSKAPRVRFYGGGNTGNNQNNPTFGSATLPDFAAPANPARAHCIMTGTAPNMSVSSIVIDNPGSGYPIAPFVFLENDPNDSLGAAIASATNGIEIVPQGTYVNNGIICTTDQISVFCATLGAAYTFKFTV